MSLRRIALVGAAASAMAFAVGSPASAATPAAAPALAPAVAVPAAAPSTCNGSHSSTQSDDGGSYVCWFPTGELLKTCDNRSDGRSPGVKYRVNGGSWHTTIYHFGFGNCGTVNLDLPESDTIDFQAVNYKDAALVSSSIIVRDSARGQNARGRPVGTRAGRRVRRQLRSVIV